jgi:hypothetical protein
MHVPFYGLPLANLQLLLAAKRPTSNTKGPRRPFHSPWRYVDSHSRRRLPSEATCYRFLLELRAKLEAAPT